MIIRNPGRCWILVKEAAPAGPNRYDEIEGEAMIPSARIVRISVSPGGVPKRPVYSRVSQKRHPSSALMGPR
jgi:hypothetical protein